MCVWCGIARRRQCLVRLLRGCVRAQERWGLRFSCRSGRLLGRGPGGGRGGLGHASCDRRPDSKRYEMMQVRMQRQRLALVVLSSRPPVLPDDFGDERLGAPTYCPDFFQGPACNIECANPVLVDYLCISTSIGKIALHPFSFLRARGSEVMKVYPGLNSLPLPLPHISAHPRPP